MGKRCLYFLLLVIVILTSCGVKTKKAEPLTSADSLKTAIAGLTEKISMDVANPDLYNSRSKLYLQDRQFDPALKDINKAISISPKRPEYYTTLSDIYLMMGKPENCRQALSKAIELDPVNEEAIVKIAKLHLIIKDYPKTFQFIKRALEIDKISPEAYFIRAIALLESGDTTHAIQDLQTAVEQNQQYFDALMELGEIYSVRKNALAADYLKSALNLKPSSKEALYMLGMFYQENDQYEKAIQTYSILRKTDPAYKNAPYNIGYIYLVYLKDFPKAVSYFSEALGCDPGYVEAYYNRGLAYEYNGEYDKAYKDYKKALTLHVNYEKAIEALNRLDKVMARK